MQKFPFHMNTRELLITELYRDPLNEEVTAISLYLTPKTTMSTGQFIEIAYGTHAGTVRVIVQHPENVGSAPQLFQTFTVHRARVVSVMLSEKYLISVCAEQNHVRTWTVTRFRGMISTQPGSMPLASFKVLSLDSVLPPTLSPSTYASGNPLGPFGDKDDYQLFVQKLLPFTHQMHVRLASDGRHICTVSSVDGSAITGYTVHEFDSSSRLGSRPRRFLLTGHSNGSVQMWDVTTAIDRFEPDLKSRFFNSLNLDHTPLPPLIYRTDVLF